MGEGGQKNTGVLQQTKQNMTADEYRQCSTGHDLRECYYMSIHDGVLKRGTGFFPRRLS